MANDPQHDLNDPEHSRLGADDRAHGTHGKGGSEERLDDEKAPRAERSERSLEQDELRGSEGWGNESAGGSRIDRTPEKKGRD